MLCARSLGFFEQGTGVLAHGCACVRSSRVDVLLMRWGREFGDPFSDWTLANWEVLGMGVGFLSPRAALFFFFFFPTNDEVPCAVHFWLGFSVSICETLKAPCVPECGGSWQFFFFRRVLPRLRLVVNICRETDRLVLEAGFGCIESQETREKEKRLMIRNAEVGLWLSYVRQT